MVNFCISRLIRKACINHQDPTHEFLDLIVRLALGLKVTSALGSTHVQTSQCILEDLLETQAVMTNHGNPSEIDKTSQRDGSLDSFFAASPLPLAAYRVSSYGC